MTVKEFLKEKLDEKISVLPTMAEQIDINGVKLKTVPMEIIVENGIETIAELYGQEIKTRTERPYSSSRYLNIYSTVEVGNVQFVQVKEKYSDSEEV